MDYDIDNGDYDSDYICEMESDQEEAIDSSEDELEIVLHGTPEQRRKLDKQLSIASNGKKARTGENKDGDSSDDDFEKQMAAELTATMSVIEKKHKSGVSLPSTSESSSKKEESPQFYDNMYFDSDSDEEGTKQEKKGKKHPIPSNDDLLYDPEADAADQTWVNEQRRRYQITNPCKGNDKSSSNKRPHALPNSDAILNCPACMVQLCLDCQRHEKFQNQYRAMFVMNCKVDFSQRLKFPKQHQQKKKNKKRKMEETETAAEGTINTQDGAEEETFHPVKCEQCNTEVAVYDTDEVFHFFNILASHA